MSSRAFASEPGTVWLYANPNDDEETLFLVLDGHYEQSIYVPVGRGPGRKRVSVPTMIPFRNCLNLTIGNFSGFSKDSLMNKRGKRFR